MEVPYHAVCAHVIMAWCQLLQHWRTEINSLRSSDAYVGNLTIIGSNNGLSYGGRQAII